ISGGVAFTAQVIADPKTAVYEVWATYTDGTICDSNTGAKCWRVVPLMQCDPASLPAICGVTADSQIWMGSVATAAPAIQYIVQAASGTGLVTFDDNRGAYYAFDRTQTQNTSTTQQAAAAAPTVLTFVSGYVPTSAKYGDAVSVTANLTSGGQ